MTKYFNCWCEGSLGLQPIQQLKPYVEGEEQSPLKCQVVFKVLTSSPAGLPPRVRGACRASPRSPWRRRRRSATSLGPASRPLPGRLRSGRSRTSLPRQPGKRRTSRQRTSKQLLLLPPSKPRLPRTKRYGRAGSSSRRPWTGQGSRRHTMSSTSRLRRSLWSL